MNGTAAEDDTPATSADILVAMLTDDFPELAERARQVLAADLEPAIAEEIVIGMVRSEITWLQAGCPTPKAANPFPFIRGRWPVPWSK